MDKTYIATLYKNGVAIAEQEQTDAEKVDFANVLKDEKGKPIAGTYKVSVIVKGADDGSSESSEPTVSEGSNSVSIKSS